MRAGRGPGFASGISTAVRPLTECRGVPCRSHNLPEPDLTQRRGGRLADQPQLRSGSVDGRGSTCSDRPQRFALRRTRLIARNGFVRCARSSCNELALRRRRLTAELPEGPAQSTPGSDATRVAPAISDLVHFGARGRAHRRSNTATKSWLRDRRGITGNMIAPGQSSKHPGAWSQHPRPPRWPLDDGRRFRRASLRWDGMATADECSAGTR